MKKYGTKYFLLAVTYSNIGRVYLDQGKIEEAHKNFNK